MRDEEKIKAGEDLRREADELIRGVWIITPAWRDV